MSTPDSRANAIRALKRQTFEELHRINERAAREKRGYTAAEKSRSDALHRQLDELDAAGSRGLIERRDKMDTYSRPSVDVSGPDGAEQMRRWIRGEGPKTLDINFRSFATRFNRNGSWNVETAGGLSNVDARTFYAGSATGSSLVPQRFEGTLFQALVAMSAIRQANPTIFQTDDGRPLVLPKVTAEPSDGTIIGEGATLNANDPTFGNGTLLSYKFGNIVQVSTELVQDTGVDLVGYLTSAFARAVHNGEGRYFLTGTGSGQPQGVLVGAGTVHQVTGGTGTSGIPTADEVISTWYKLPLQYRANAYWLMSDSAAEGVRKLKASGTGQYLWTEGLGEAPSSLMGRPVLTDPYMPAAGLNGTSIAVGDFSNGYAMRTLPLRLERSDDYAFGNDLVSFRVLERADGLVVNSAAFATYVGGTA